MAIDHRTWPTSALPAETAGASRGTRAGRSLEAAELEPPVVPTADPTVAPEPARAMMWSLEAGGWTEREAGNLVGLAHGLRPARAGWTEREIEHLRFLRALVESGRLDH
ncbi:MAG TPA: hypothetical protein VGI98_01310 [Candidatus Limnocylindrales bacterium]|jgi:hypothetical protein